MSTIDTRCTGLSVRVLVGSSPRSASVLGQRSWSAIFSRRAILLRSLTPVDDDDRCRSCCSVV